MERKEKRRSVLMYALFAVIAIGGIKGAPAKAYSYMDETRHHEDYVNAQYYWNKAAKNMFAGREKILKRKRKGLKKARSGHVAWTGADAMLFEHELQMREMGLSTKHPSWGVHEHGTTEARQTR